MGRWQDLPESHILECRWALSHLDERGLHYYLPALMVHYLRTPRTHHTEIHHSLRYTLPPTRGELRDFQKRRFSLLTLAQREAILAWVEYVGLDDVVIASWRRATAKGDDPHWFEAFNPKV